MKIFCKILKISTYVVVAVVLLIGCLTIYHHIAISWEKNKMTPPGLMVTVDGHKMHIYAEGEKSDKPTLIFMGGHGTLDPVYDFKILYSKLSDDYRIVVVERFGYGYSDVSDLPKDVATEVRQSREALISAGELGPYILVPHSQSGIAAIYWANQYPNEVSAIVSLDTVYPYTIDVNLPTYSYSAERFMNFIGMFRVYYPKYGVENYTQAEAKQRKLIVNAKAFSKDILAEEAAKVDSINLVNGLDPLNIPILAFSTPLFREATVAYAAKSSNMQIVEMDSDHFIHHTESVQIAEKTKTFLSHL